MSAPLHDLHSQGVGARLTGRGGAAAVVVEDLIKWLDIASNGLRKGKYPQRSQAEKMAMALRKVADDLEA